MTALANQEVVLTRFLCETHTFIFQENIYCNPGYICYNQSHMSTMVSTLYYWDI